jgi:hypothetical protein
VSGPPDFVGAGVQGAGATWWAALLASHPGIRLDQPRERNHFEPFCAREMSDDDVTAYHATFPREDDELAGEWSDSYLYDFWTAPLLRRAAPDTRVLVLLRDPIERFRAGLAHQRRVAPRRKEHLATTDAVERGRYGWQLARLLEHFDEGRVLVLQYERCRADPAGEYARTLAFLGADPAHRPVDLAAPPEEPLPPAPWPDLEQGILEALADDLDALFALAPGLDRSLWPHVA